MQDTPDQAEEVQFPEVYELSLGRWWVIDQVLEHSGAPRVFTRHHHNVAIEERISAVQQ